MGSKMSGHLREDNGGYCWYITYRLMDFISSDIGNRDGDIPSSNPICSDFEQKRQTSDHGES